MLRRRGRRDGEKMERRWRLCGRFSGGSAERADVVEILGRPGDALEDRSWPHQRISAQATSFHFVRHASLPT